MLQRYDARIEVERELHTMPYDLRHKNIGEYEYLNEIFARKGNGRSLAPTDEDSWPL